MAEPFRLPAGLQIRFKRCGEPQAYFDAGSSSLVFCYDLAQWFTFAFAPHIRTGEELSAAIWHAALFAIYHEYGHALIELFDLEPSGGAENLAHELSALALFESDEETVRVVAHGAGWLMVHASDLVPRIPYWQAHSFERERYEQLVCWAYGSDPDAFAALAGGRQLTAERAPNCREEYRALRRRWWGVLESAMR